MLTHKVAVSSACMTRMALFADKKSGRLKQKNAREIEYLSSNKAVIRVAMYTHRHMLSCEESIFAMVWVSKI